MVCDLDYFYESDLDVTNIKEFYYTIPPHLQSKFRASLHGIQIGEGNALQGYRGPSEMCNKGSGDSKELKSSHGLQEIKFWWGARKDFNFIPIVRTIIYTGCRTNQYFSGELEWSSLYFDSHTGECLSHDKHEAVKKIKSRRWKAKSKMQASVSNYDSDDDSEYREEYYANMTRELAEDLDSQGDEWAIEISQLDGRIQEYRANIANDHDEIDALNLNSQGNTLFNDGRYWEALSEYQLADQKSQAYEQTQEYRSNVAKAQVEVDALELNCQGHNYMSQNRFDDAISMYLEAHAKSEVSAQRKQYEANAHKAKAEADADIFNYQGHKLFKEGKYTAALIKYQDACNKSERVARIKIYGANLAKAQDEIEARNSNVQGNNFYYAGRYNDAVKMYLEAYSKSQRTTRKDVYLSNKNIAQDVINKLNTLDTLWKQAWDVENDTKTDRSVDAKDLFQKILSESQENLKSFPENSKFEQFKALAALKIEGNELFNEGINSQEKGMVMFEKAQELNQQDKYQLANQKFKEAKKYFQEALEKFEKESESDQRFAACVGLEITGDNHSDVRSCETNVTEKHNNYSQHI